MISYMMVLSYVRLALAVYYRSVRTSLSTIRVSGKERKINPMYIFESHVFSVKKAPKTL